MKKKAVQLIEPQEIYINSATNIGGKTRVFYKINLPGNTTEWYYIFTTSPNTKGSNLNLLQQLSSLITMNPLMSITISALSVDNGEHPIDIFLMNDKGLKEFNERGMFNEYTNSRPSYFPDGSVLNSKEGKVRINNLNRGSFYLGLRNPSMNVGVNVRLEVVAIVEDINIDNSKWSKKLRKCCIINSLKA